MLSVILGCTWVTWKHLILLDLAFNNIYIRSPFVLLLRENICDYSTWCPGVIKFSTLAGGPVWVLLFLPFDPFRCFFSCPLQVPCMHAHANQISVEELRGTHYRSLSSLSVQLSPLQCSAWWTLSTLAFHQYFLNSGRLPSSGRLLLLCCDWKRSLNNKLG